MVPAESPANYGLHEVEAALGAEPMLTTRPESRGPRCAALGDALGDGAPLGESTDAGEGTVAAEIATDELLGLLYRQLRRLAGPRPDLDDIVQAAAERALKSLPRFERRAQLSTWTYGVAYRTLLDHDRWYARFKRRFIHTDDAIHAGAAVHNGSAIHSGSAIHNGSAMPVEPRTRFDSEALLIEVERARRLYQALEQLPNAKRAVLILHDLEGLPASEVALVVGVNEGTIRSRLRDGRAKLAEILGRDPLFRSGETP